VGRDQDAEAVFHRYHWGAYAGAAVDEIGVFRRALAPAEVDWLFKFRSPLR
jgi:hypothetical protein